MSLQYPHVTVIIIDLGDETALEATRLSVKAQDCPELDYIVVQHVVDEELFMAINSGCEKARGLVPDSSSHWLQILKAGECYANDHTVSLLLSLPCASNREVQVIGGGTASKRAMTSDIISEGMPFSLGACLIRADVCRFDQDYQFAADYALLYNVYYQNGAQSIVSIEEPVLAEEVICRRHQIYSRYVEGERLGIQSQHFSWRWLKRYLKWKFKWF